MKAVISKVELVKLISKIQNIVPIKPAIPILSNLLIEAVDDQLILSATDLITSMRCYSSAKIVEEGAITLPAKRFFHLIREFSSPQIKITTANDIAEITSGTSVFKLHGMSKSEFPSLADISTALPIPIQSANFLEMLSKTSFSTAKEDNNFVLNGLFLRVVNQKATLISTDGKRLAKTETTFDIDPSFQGQYILPLKAAEEMMKILEGEEKSSFLALMHDKVFLEHGNMQLVTKLLAGQYPDVERVIPLNPRFKVSLHREELIALLRQVSLFTSEEVANVHFVFTAGELCLYISNADCGEGRVSMPIDCSGEKVEIAFNPFYFLDVLRHSKEETVQFAFEDSFTPGVISDSSNALFVLMPMRLIKTAPQLPQEISDDSEKPVFA
jgi:DNA polymerase III subunit beta